MNANWLLAIALVIVLLVVGGYDAYPQVNCSTVTYVGPNGRTVTCMQCYYAASNQIIVSNCTGG